MLGDDDLGSAFVEVGDDGVAVEGLVAEQSAELDIPDQRSDADGVEQVTGHQHKADQIARRIGQSEDFRGHAAPGATDSLTLGPPFEPCP